MIPNDPVFGSWTDDADAPPPVTAGADNRRRRYIGGVARLILFALLLGV